MPLKINTLIENKIVNSSNWILGLMGVTATFATASVMYLWPESIWLARSIFTLAIIFGTLSSAAILLKTRGVIRELRIKNDKFIQALDFLSDLMHCQNACSARQNGWIFGTEYRLINGRDNILNKFFEIIRYAEEDSEVLFITAGFNLRTEERDMLLSKVKTFKFRWIVNEDATTQDSQNFIDILSSVVPPKKANTNGIRLLLVKGKEGYICNSKSLANGGSPDEYWAIYSKTPANLQMFELVFDNLYQTK